MEEIENRIKKLTQGIDKLDKKTDSLLENSNRLNSEIKKFLISELGLSRYLVIPPDDDPFWADDFDPENQYTEKMTVIDVLDRMIYQGEGWGSLESLSFNT